MTYAPRAWTRHLVSLAALLLLTACDHRVASEKALDVCTLALEPAATLLGTTPQAAGDSHPPTAGQCQFTTAAGREGPRRISVTVMTKASTAPTDLSGTARMLLAEAEQNFGDPGTGDFGELAKLAVSFGAAPGSIRQVVIGERGVLMEVGLDGTATRREQVEALVTTLWSRVIEYRPPES